MAATTTSLRSRRRGAAIGALALLLLAAPGCVLAQRPPSALPSNAVLQLPFPAPIPASGAARPFLESAGPGAAAQSGNQRSTGRLVASGIASGAAGALAGGLIAGGLRSLGACDDQDGCIGVYADWAVTGALLGQSLALPVGVHLGNDRRGRLAPALLTSAGIGTVGLLGYRGIQRHGTDDWGNTRGNPDALTAVTLVAMPVLELAASIAIERATARRRVR
jgi:hypothetical protein